jgi:hypothetical protein
MVLPMLSGFVRVGEHWGLAGEVAISPVDAISDPFAFATAGARLMGRHWSVDLGLLAGQELGAQERPRCWKNSGGATATMAEKCCCWFERRRTRMNDYIIFMHNDAELANADVNTDAWTRYFAMLRSSGRFSGGSSIGDGVCVTKTGQARPITTHLTGYIRVQAESLEDAKTLLDGNPVLEEGGTVEIRLLPRD